MSDPTRRAPWSPRLERALRLAATAHEGQTRKGTPTPYIEHPMAVAMILDRAGFDEDTIVAGLLHDVVEDTDTTLDVIRDGFGPDVAATVAACSEVKLDDLGVKRPWADRKHDHLKALRGATPAARAVTLADKLHNLACIDLDLADGRPVWTTFNAKRDDVLAYYRTAVSVCGQGDPRLVALARDADEMLGRVERDG